MLVIFKKLIVMKRTGIAVFLILLSTIVLKAQSNQTKKNVGKIIFATQPLGNGNVSTTKSFKSSDFIYGQLIPNDGKLFNELLDMPGGNKDSIYPKWYLYYVVKVYKKKEQMSSSNNATSCLFTDINWNIKTLNIDILPSPKNGTTQIINDFNVTETTPLYALIDASHFPENGTYTIKVEVYDETVDAWGNKKAKGEWPSFEGEFDFNFNSKDIATLIKNKETVNTDLRTAKRAKEKIKEDAAWALQRKEYTEQLVAKQKEQEENQKKTMDAYNANAKAAIEKMEMPKSWSAKSASTAVGFTVAQIRKEFTEHSDENAKIIKVYIEPGASWFISKNSFGIPTGQYINTEILVFYRVKDECMARNMYIEKTYLGGGKYGAASIHTGASDEKLPCSKMK
jgi:hypothetical protein